MWPCFLSNILIREWDKGGEREREGMQWTGGIWMHLSDLRPVSHTGKDPRFPFLQLFQHHPMQFLEREEALLFLRCPMMSSTPLQRTKNPLRPEPQPPTPNRQPPAPPFKTPPHAFLKSGTFSDLSGKKTKTAEQGVNPPSPAPSYFTKLQFK